MFGGEVEAPLGAGCNAGVYSLAHSWEMQEHPQSMFVEYAPWAGVLISTNSTYPHGISRSRIFDRGTGGIVVSFNPEGILN